jgi:hypothetical protein
LWEEAYRTYLFHYFCGRPHTSSPGTVARCLPVSQLFLRQTAYQFAWNSGKVPTYFIISAADRIPIHLEQWQGVLLNFFGGRKGATHPSDQSFFIPLSTLIFRSRLSFIPLSTLIEGGSPNHSRNLEAKYNTVRVYNCVQFCDQLTRHLDFKLCYSFFCANIYNSVLTYNRKKLSFVFSVYYSKFLS